MFPLPRASQNGPVFWLPQPYGGSLSVRCPSGGLRISAAAMFPSGAGAPQVAAPLQPSSSAGLANRASGPVDISLALGNPPQRNEAIMGMVSSKEILYIYICIYIYIY